VKTRYANGAIIYAHVQYIDDNQIQWVPENTTGIEITTVNVVIGEKPKVGDRVRVEYESGSQPKSGTGATVKSIAKI